MELKASFTEKKYFVTLIFVTSLFMPLMGMIANTDVATAYYLPIICYAVIFLFGYKFYKAD